jgi:lipopolysaccharide biosynthesis glycosyltransferase
MNIVTALNQKYIPYTGTMLVSLAVNEKEHVDAYLLHSELTDADIKSLEKAVYGYDMSIIPLFVDKKNFSERLPHNDQWSLETYYRLMMLELLPDTVDRALYLDGDMIINKSLRELYNSDFEEAEIIACDDKSGLNTPDRYGPKHNEMFRIPYENGYRYFNAGVMLLNIDRLREKYSFQTYLEAIEAWNYEMEAPDQDILNWVHWRNVAYADCMVYDLFARVAHNAEITYEEVKEAAAIIHFAGAKPWNNENFHFDIERLWWEYAKLTPFYESLLKDFVETAMTDKTVERYLQELVREFNSRRESLDIIMKRISNITNSGDSK